MCCCSIKLKSISLINPCLQYHNPPKLALKVWEIELEGIEKGDHMFDKVNSPLFNLFHVWL